MCIVDSLCWRAELNNFVKQLYFNNIEKIYVWEMSEEVLSKDANF